MSLPFGPPLAPMLARLVRDLPGEGFVYEPKWDGFRCLAFCDGQDVELRSRHDRPLGRYFPEIVAGLRGLGQAGLALDGEIVLAGPQGFDFAALMGRLHPAASRVARLSVEQPASYVAFDLLAVDEGGRPVDLRDRPFVERRERLRRALADANPPIFVTPATTDLGLARRWFESYRGAGVDGIVAKHESLTYQAGRRAMLKVKHERTADCVLAGARLFPGTRTLSSLLLGLYGPDRALHHVGVVTQLPAAMRLGLPDELAPLIVPIGRHPWRGGFIIGHSPLGRLKGSAARWTPEMELDWLPLRPERVCEVGFDQVDVDRFRHPARFRRWRPDRAPESCLLDQIEVQGPELVALLEGPGAAA